MMSTPILTTSHYGVVRFGDLAVEAVVLEDGTRGYVQRLNERHMDRGLPVDFAPINDLNHNPVAPDLGNPRPVLTTVAIEKNDLVTGA